MSILVRVGHPIVNRDKYQTRLGRFVILSESAVLSTFNGLQPIKLEE